ncbi:asparagine synthase (glutamine-hydrolyzing) [bacterium]|nr:asparagine synthase (glutamine-hydrolyzing) [bacterium]
MSGICGIFSFKNEEPVEEKVLKKMTDALYHRGPDEEGYHFDAGIGLGIRRLAILDLETGHQPIHNEDENIWIVCDGEVYNFLDQRRDLEKKGHHFYTKTDVEIIVHLYEEHGIDCLHFLRGTFSFAIWDKRKRCLFLVRDPIGGKPLYYVLQNSNIIFASEINAILQNPQIERQVNLDAIHLYLTYEYIPSPLTAFQGIEKLTPAHHLFCDRNGGFKIERYWDLRFDKKLNISEEECEKEIYQRLKEATKLRLIGDVPLGAFLSGGYDSSIIVGLMAQEMSTKLKTFTIGFEEKNFSELNYAEIVAKHFGTEHHAFIIGPEVIDTLPDIVRCCGEPFADSSVLPTYHIAKVSQKEITVALNGDGGDEDFGGYPRYQAVRKAEIFSLPFRLIPKKFLHMLADSISVNKPQPSRYFPVNYVRKLLQASIDLPGRINISWQAIFNNKLKYQLYSKEMRKKFA